MTGTRVGAVLAVACISGSAAAGAIKYDDELRAASSDAHVWYLQESADHAVIELRHHAYEEGGPWQTSMAALTRMPETLTARDNRVWMVFPPIAGERSDKRDVATLRVDFNPVVGAYERNPRDLLGAEQPLPVQGELKGFVSSGRTLFALLAPVGGERRTESGEMRPELPTLLRLHSDGWSPVSLPAGVHPTSLCRIAVSGDDARHLHLLIANRFQPDRTDMFTLEGDDEWSRIELDLDMAAILDLATVGGRLAAVIDGGEDAVRLVYLFNGQIVEIATLARPQRQWKILGVRDRLLLLSRTPTGMVEMQQIDPVRGTLGPAESLVAKPIGAELIWQTALLATAFAMAVLFILVGRPSARKPVILPKNVTVLSPISRLMALLIDMVPGGIVACLVFRVAPTELARLPMMVGTFADSAPYVLMVVITVGHGAITELVRMTTMGKAMSDARVVGLTGAAPARSAVVTRNILKLVVLVIPPLAVFGLLTPHFQGLHDLVARTVIVARREEPVE